MYALMTVPDQSFDEFFALVTYQFIYQFDEEEDADPEGEFDAYHYVLYTNGFVGRMHSLIMVILCRIRMEGFGRLSFFLDVYPEERDGSACSFRYCETEHS